MRWGDGDGMGWDGVRGVLFSRTRLTIASCVARCVLHVLHPKIRSLVR